MSKTQYRMANQEDRIQIHESFDLDAPLGFPVYIAIRDDKIVGFLATQDRKDMVVAGPLQINLEKKAFVCMRLVDGYDKLMKSMGMTLYWFYVDKSTVPKWLNAVKESGICKEFGTEGDNIWFERRL